MENRKYWSGIKITSLKPEEVFVFGANPQAKHFAGAAKSALGFGAVPINVKQKKPGIARGLSPNNKTYALITKSLEAGYTEPETGIVYDKEGFRSVSPEQIRYNIDELYVCAKNHPDKQFLISYQYDTWPNGTPKKSLNGYDSQEMLEMFVREDIPDNIVFHDSYKKHLERLLSSKNNNSKAPMTQEYTYFFHLTSPFSNFHPSRFTYQDYTFISNEQFMMFSKAKNFKDEESADRILNIHKEFAPNAQGFFKTEEDKIASQLISAFRSGQITRQDILKDKQCCEVWNTIHKKIKQLGRGVKNYDDVFWSKKRVSVVHFGAREKFTQNQDLQKILLDTGTTLMCEVSKWDKVWGCGLSEADARRTPPEQWPGENLLGKVLDKVKYDIQVKLSNSPAQTPAQKIEANVSVHNFYHLGKTIPEDGVYMGRANHNFNLPQSKFANPYPVRTPEERGTTIEKYRAWLWQQIANNVIVKEDLLALNNKKLICYCAPKPCHTYVVKETLELLINNEETFDKKVQEHRNMKNKMKF